MTLEHISFDKEKRLQEKMLKHGIFEQDIKEAFVHAQGKGGQNVNKVSTCVQLIHQPTGIGVKFQGSRSQAFNRYWARDLLVEKILEQRKKTRLEEIQRIEKLRRQNRKRPKSLKEVILENKKKHGQKKGARSKIAVHKMEKYF